MKQEQLERMKNSSLSDLVSWKKNMESYQHTELFDQVQYDTLSKEIERRKVPVSNDTEEITMRMVKLYEELASEFGENAVDKVVSILPEVMRIYNANKKRRR